MLSAVAGAREAHQGLRICVCVRRPQRRTSAGWSWPGRLRSRALRVPDRGVGVRVQRRRRERGRAASSSLASIPRLSSHPSPACSATAIRASACSSSRISRGSCSSRAAAVAVFADAIPWIVYGLSIAATIATTPFRSSQAALTPNLARTPQELTAANAVSSGIESIAWFAGPALAGILLAVASTGARVPDHGPAHRRFGCAFSSSSASSATERPRRELEASTIAAERMAGFTTLGRSRALRVMMVLLTAQTAIFGAVQVFIVVVAIQLLDLGDGGVGYLNAAMGVGAFIGAVRRTLAHRRPATQPRVPCRDRPHRAAARPARAAGKPSPSRCSSSRSWGLAARSSTSRGSRSSSEQSLTTCSRASSASSR